MSDGLAAAVKVFAPDGTYLGIIGRITSGDPASGSFLRARAALWLEGDRLVATDRMAGVVSLRLGTPPASPSPPPAE